MRYAENPPKKYEDIVNVDFYAHDAIPGLWYALRDIVLFWAEEGIRIFRVDNPHTKPLPFWEWLIADVRSRHPDVIFLSEAFTRPKMMYRLAKVGFSQSYTYFTWRNTKQELTDYFVELTTTEVKDFFRPHLFVNTPDINPHFLQTSGRPGFLIRAALAATLSGLWGMYSGFELCEAAALPGREEYLNSEKYRDPRARLRCARQHRRRNFEAQSHPQEPSGAAEPSGIAFLSRAQRSDYLLRQAAARRRRHDPGRRQPRSVSRAGSHNRSAAMGMAAADDASVTVHDLMRDTISTWHGKLQRIRLDPADLPFALWRVSPSCGSVIDGRANHNKRPTTADQLWYKDAIIYQLHVKSFFDSNDDGIGDFPGLISKLDYIADLGANVIWLLPFYPSPRLDDGYDISAYREVHPDYGTLADFRHFVRAAHARNIRVITELVVNHTSDQHPWFQRARRAKPGSLMAQFLCLVATPIKNMPARASSLSMPSGRTGRGIRSPAPITGIASTRTSPI